jgi:hypothetical protein
MTLELAFPRNTKRRNVRSRIRLLNTKRGRVRLGSLNNVITKVSGRTLCLEGANCSPVSGLGQQPAKEPGANEALGVFGGYTFYERDKVKEGEDRTRARRYKGPPIL